MHMADQERLEQNPAVREIVLRATLLGFKSGAEYIPESEANKVARQLAAQEAAALEAYIRSLFPSG